MKYGSWSFPTDPNIVFQSERLRGEKIFVPHGQLFASCDRRTSKQFLHLTNGPGEYGPFKVMRSHLQVFGFFFSAFGLMDISMTPVHSFASDFPFAIAGRVANSANLD
jgi:hypothetical protein